MKAIFSDIQNIHIEIILVSSSGILDSKEQATRGMKGDMP